MTSDGRVLVRRALSGDNTEEYRLRVRVSDGGAPALTNSTIVRIRIERNLCEPSFVGGQRVYTFTIPETQTLGMLSITCSMMSDI